MHGSPRAYMTDRQGLTWQQTFFKRVISLSSTRWFFSLLGEQWGRERSADGLVTEFRVKQVRGHRVAGLLLAKGPDSSFGGVPVGYCPDEVHREEEGVQVQAEEEEIGETHGREQGEEKGRTNNQVTHMDDYVGGTKRVPTLEPCSVMCHNGCVFTA